MAHIPLEQRIGLLTEEKLKVPCAAFTHITVDLTGPYQVAEMIRLRTEKRAEMKVLVILLYEYRRSTHGAGQQTFNSCFLAHLVRIHCH